MDSSILPCNNNVVCLWSALVNKVQRYITHSVILKGIDGKEISINISGLKQERLFIQQILNIIVTDWEGQKLLKVAAENGVIFVGESHAHGTQITVPTALASDVAILCVLRQLIRFVQIEAGLNPALVSFTAGMALMERVANADAAVRLVQICARLSRKFPELWAKLKKEHPVMVQAWHEARDNHMNSCNYIFLQWFENNNDTRQQASLVASQDTRLHLVQQKIWQALHQLGSPSSESYPLFFDLTNEYFMGGNTIHSSAKIASDLVMPTAANAPDSLFDAA
ncbi:MAG: DUF6782 family putative metallopeptidase [Alphaproteobacteria bacterium]